MISGDFRCVSFFNVFSLINFGHLSVLYCMKELVPQIVMVFWSLMEYFSDFELLFFKRNVLIIHIILCFDVDIMLGEY